jgi:hypothetical protein
MTYWVRLGLTYRSYIEDYNPFAMQKWFWKAAFNFDATCPDVQARLGPKFERVMVGFPAWIFYILFFIFRFILVIWFAIVIAIAWVIDFIW